MYMLGSVACLLYATAFSALLYVGNSRLRISHLPDEELDRLIERPEKAEGRLGEILGYVLHGPILTIKTVGRRFDEVRNSMLAGVDRRLLVLNTLVAAAPLAGLLGMLAMFAGLAQGSGPAGMKRVAAGMQEALITTQTGLTIALPGLFVALIIKARRNRVNADLTRMQSKILSARFHR
jgi:biopolymer transport protein ExbB